MKRCPYCGRENSDDATICVIDHQPLAPELHEVTPDKISVRMGPRPSTVKFAVGLLAFGTVFDLALILYKYQLSGARTRGFYSTIVFTFGIATLFIYLVFRGKNWARWSVVCAIILGILAGPFMRIGPAHWDTYFFTFIDMAAVVALLQRPSNEWYRGTKTIVAPPLPVS